MAITIREAADKLKISKQAVQNRIKEIPSFRDDYITKVGNRFEISDEGYSILEHFDKENHQKRQEKSDNKNGNVVDKQMLDVLAEQLKVKDKQIAELNKALDQQQQLSLLTTQENRQLKEKVDKLGGYLTADKEDEEKTKEPKQVHKKPVGFWGKLFGKK